MARVLVVGGTGLAGRHAASEAILRGHEVRIAARRVPDDDSEAYVDGAEYLTVDLVTASGLDEALDGMDVIIDTTNGVRRSSQPVLTVGALNLLHAAARWGVSRAVLLSIVNVDQSAYRYYRAKAAQELAYRDSVLETRIVRATQFHEFVTSLFESASRFGIVPTFRKVSFQPISTRDVARLLVDAAEGAGEPDSTTSSGGPEVLTSRELALQWKQLTGKRGLLLPSPLPRGLGATWRSGSNLVPGSIAGELTYSEWLTSRV